MTKLIAASRNFTNAPKKCDWSESCNENHQNLTLSSKFRLDQIQENRMELLRSTHGNVKIVRIILMGKFDGS